ncbi:MAG: hypothetical protein U1D97_06710 [Desulfuromonadales bacterium]|nr:hypothetical protein [Desulfuromonadales bacterium]
MLRIVWGVVFIVVGLLLISSAAFGSVLMGEVAKFTGEFIDAQSKNTLILEFVLGVGLCFGGSLLVYYGDAARQERIELIVDLLTVRKKSNKDEQW